MNKEEILHKLQKENPHSIPTFKAMDEWAKQQAIAFVKYCMKFFILAATTDETVCFDGYEFDHNSFEDVVEKRYNQFIEQQNKHE